MAQLKRLLLMAQSSSFLITRRFCWELRVWLHPGQWESRSWALSLRLVGAAGRADLWGDGMATSKQKGDLPPELFPPPSFWGCCSVNTDDNTEAKPVVSSVSLQLSLLSPRRTRGHITVPCREQDRRTGHITSLRFKALCLYLSAAVAFCLESCSGWLWGGKTLGDLRLSRLAWSEFNRPVFPSLRRLPPLGPPSQAVVPAPCS